MKFDIGVLLVILLMVIVISIFMALPTMLLWNWLMPTIFGLKTITFMQALGLNILSNILFNKTSSSTSNSK